MKTPRILTALALTLVASTSLASDCPVTANLNKALAGIAEAAAAK